MINTVSFAKRLLHRCIRLEEEVEYGSGKTGQDTVDMQTEIEDLQRAWAALNFYYERKLDQAEADKLQTANQFKAGFMRQAGDQQAVTESIEAEVGKLQHELKTVRFQNDVFQNQLRS
ncbi:hypothetical protein PHYBOEH_000918 [Phytophthora boehmeriae]|uniref:Uncharacterized protein n=1 Tax=Phytophthora boehmeriae TaxID=109152 RepID=A0A8T1V8U3_9STRA|nr:hypothetical protein PHYBOEH_000918 [Phytophthora boehmeriae]